MPTPPRPCASLRGAPPCSRCGFTLYVPIAPLAVGWLGLYDDGLFPGRCLLVYQHHVEHLTELTPDEGARFFADIQKAARAILATTDAGRMNYAVLGNKEPHLHAHLIPRYSDEPAPGTPPWLDPRPKRSIDPDHATVLRESIRNALMGPA